MPPTPSENSYGLENPEVKRAFEEFAMKVRNLAHQNLSLGENASLSSDFSKLADRYKETSFSCPLNKPLRIGDFFEGIIPKLKSSKSSEDIDEVFQSRDLYKEFELFYLKLERKAVNEILVKDDYGLDNPEVKLAFETFLADLRKLLHKTLSSEPDPLSSKAGFDTLSSEFKQSSPLVKPFRIPNFLEPIVGRLVANKRYDEIDKILRFESLYEDYKNYYNIAERSAIEGNRNFQNEIYNEYKNQESSMWNDELSPSDIEKKSKKIESNFLKIAPNGTKALQSLFFLKRNNISEKQENVVFNVLDDLWPKFMSFPLRQYSSTDDFFKFLANNESFITSLDISIFASQLELNFTSLFHSCPDFIQSINKKSFFRFDIGGSYTGVQRAQLLIKDCLNLDSFDIETRKAHLYNYLLVYFSLGEKDIPQNFLDYALSASPDDLLRMTLNNEDLIIRGIANSIAVEVKAYGVSEDFSRQVSEKILNLVIDRLIKKPKECLRDVVYREALRDIQEVAKGHAEGVKDLRDIALMSHLTKEISNVIGEESEYAYSDAQIIDEYQLEDWQKAVRRGIYLPTWFDHAQFGFINRKRRNDAIEKREDSKDFNVLNYESSNALIDYYCPDDHGEFNARNVYFFSEGGSQAFDRFSAYIKSTDAVLVTNQVYEGIVSSIKNRGVLDGNLEYLPPYTGNDKAYTKAMLDIVGKNKNLKYIIVSDLSRRGTPFPLHIFKKVRDLFRGRRRDIYLILDCCQSFGRFKSDYGQSMADVIFGSAHKGTDFEKGAFLMLSNNFIDKEGRGVYKDGKEDAYAIASILLTVDPKNTSSYGEGTLAPDERHHALQILSSKFIRAMNHSEKKNWIKGFKFLHPYDASGPDGSLRAHGILECEIEGASRKQVSHMTQKYGVYIADDYQDPASSNSFRIGFHPRMNDKAIKVLVYALYKICEFARQSKKIDK